MRKQIVTFVFGFMIAAAASAATPELEMTDVHGNVHHLSDYRGKWVVVNYWATWCPPCIGEIPELVEFHDRHKNEDAVVVGISYEQIDKELLLQFVKDYLITYPIIVSSPAEDALGPVPGLPSTYLIAPDGRIAARRVGPVTADELEKFIDNGGE